MLHRRRSLSPFRSAHNDNASSFNSVIPLLSPQLTQRTLANNATSESRPAENNQNAVNTVATASDASGDSDEDEDLMLRNLRARLRQLLRRRHQILRNFIQQMGEV